MFLDLTVVYFAFGAPVGVYEITRRKRSPRTAALAAVHFVLWPLFAAASLRRLLTIRVAEWSLEQEIDDLRAQFEVAARDGGKRNDVLEFRDIYARYTGLALALAQSGHITNELFTVSSHPDSSLASRCLGRRNRRRLEFHLVQARNEFEDLVSKLTVSDPNVNKLASRLDDLLNASQD